MNFVEELKWRGMIHDIMPGTEESLNKQVTTGYCGFDPTADSLHIGSLVPIMMLVHLQRAGHKPLALVGGATGMVGDPSGKSKERNLLTPEEIEHNIAGVKKQLEKFLDFESSENPAEIVNNYDWMKEFSFIEFIRDVGKHISINYMMAKDSVQNRLETGLSFTEFSYQLLQGYDFYHLYNTKNCSLQIGGSDQWGNITTGTEMIRRMAQGEAYALTAPLVKKADGSKFGKTAEGNVWLDKERTSPYKFYQYWINASDEDVHNFIRTFTLLPREEIESLEAEHEKAPHERILQKKLAEELTERVHSKEDLEMAIEASSILFSKKATDALRRIDEDTLLSVFEGVPLIDVSKDHIQAEENLTNLLSEYSNGEIFPSKGEAKRMIKGGGVRINKEQVTDPEQPVNFELLQEKYLLVQKGKKNYYLIKAV